MSDIIKFDFKGAQVRTQSESGVVWFNGQDVARALGYKNHRDAIKKHCKPKGVANRDALSIGGKQAMLFITEPNVYRLTAHSKLPAAEAFEAWVFEKVLPEIRKTGRFALEQEVIALRHDIQLYRERDMLFGNKVRPGTISKANGLPHILPRKGTMCAPKSKHTRINAAMYQLLLFDPLTFALMLKDTVVRPSHPAESAQGTQEVGR